MLGLLGYNFCSDGNSVDPAPTDVRDITSTKLENAVYNNFYVTKDVTAPYSTNIPTEWDFGTIMLANFNGNLSAGNIAETVDLLSAIRIKRRIKGTLSGLP